MIRPSLFLSSSVIGKVKKRTTEKSVRPPCCRMPAKQDGVVYRIPCECGKVYIGETGRSMQERIKERDRDIRLACTQTSAISEHANKTSHHPLWNKVKFIDRDSHWYARRVKKAIHIRLHPDNINRDNGIEIPEASNHQETQQETGTPANLRGNNFKSDLSGNNFTAEQ